MIPIAIAVVGGFAFVAPTDSAEAVIQKALRQAKVERKPVLVYFKASWCSWCRRTDALFNDPVLGEAFEDAYVIARVTIREKPENREHENSGWEPMMQKIRGSSTKDVPYFAVLNDSGKKIAEPYRHLGKLPDNGGYPVTETERSAWIQMIRSTAPKFGNANLALLRNFFKASL
jgi:thiol-disulfide isomerase/thioredoxin